MDPITLATVTAALTTLGVEVAKGAASAGGNDLWGRVKSLFGWSADPAPAELAPAIARRLEHDDALVQTLVGLLKAQPAETASQLVGSIQAERVVVGQQINVAGDFHM